MYIILINIFCLYSSEIWLFKSQQVSRRGVVYFFAQGVGGSSLNSYLPFIEKRRKIFILKSNGEFIQNT